MSERTASERMKEIIERRDEIRRKSEERAKQGLTPFPTVEEVEAGKHARTRERELRDSRF